MEINLIKLSSLKTENWKHRHQFKAVWIFCPRLYWFVKAISCLELVKAASLCEIRFLLRNLKNNISVTICKMKIVFSLLILNSLVTFWLHFQKYLHDFFTRSCPLSVNSMLQNSLCLQVQKLHRPLGLSRKLRERCSCHCILTFLLMMERVQ